MLSYTISDVGMQCSSVNGQSTNPTNYTFCYVSSYHADGGCLRLSLREYGRDGTLISQLNLKFITAQTGFK